MARMEKIPEAERATLAALECPEFERRPWVAAAPLARRRVTVVSSAGLVRRGERPVLAGEAGYRVIPDALPDAEILCSHVSVNFDRTGFERDAGCFLPRARLRELARDGVIAGVADAHYAFMGATAPAAMEPAARELGRALVAGGVDAAILVPV